MRYFIQKNSSIRFRKKKYNLNKNISNLVYFLKRNYILVKLRFFGFPFGLQTRKRLKKVILEKCINKKNRLYKIKKIQVKESNIKFKTTYNNFNTLFFFKNYIKKYISIKFKHFFNFKRMSLYWSKKKKLKILGKNFRKINNFISAYSGLNLNGEGDISNLNIIKLPLYLPYAYSRLESTWFNTSISLNFKPEKQLLLNYIKFVLNAKYFSNYNHSWFVRMGTNYLYDFGETIIKKYFSVNPLLLWDTFYKENIGMNTLLFNFMLEPDFKYNYSLTNLNDIGKLKLNLITPIKIFKPFKFKKADTLSLDLTDYMIPYLKPFRKTKAAVVLKVKSRKKKKISFYRSAKKKFMKYYSTLNKLKSIKKKFQENKRLPRSYRNKVFRIKKIKNRAYYKKRKALNKLQRALKKKRGLQKDFSFQDLKFKYTIFKDIFVYKDFTTKFLNYRKMYSLDKRFKKLINLIFSNSTYLLKNRKVKILFFKYNSKFILSKVLLNIIHNTKNKSKSSVKNLVFKNFYFKSFNIYRNNEYLLNYNLNLLQSNKTKNQIRKSVNNFLNQIKVKNLNLLFKSFLNFDYIINNLKFMDYLTFSLKSKLLKISKFFVNVVDYLLRFNTLPLDLPMPMININFLNLIVKCLYKFKKLNLNSNYFSRSRNITKFNFNGLSLISFQNYNLPLNYIISPLILNNNINLLNLNSCTVLNSFSFSQELNKNLLMIAAVFPNLYKIKFNFNSLLKLNKFYLNKKQIFRDSFSKQIRLFRILYLKSNKSKIYKNLILDKNNSLNGGDDLKLLKLKLKDYKINFRKKVNIKKNLLNLKYTKYNFKCKNKNYKNKVISFRKLRKLRKLRNKKVKLYLKLSDNRMVLDLYQRKFLFKKFMYASSLKYKERGFLHHFFAKRTLYLNKKINFVNKIFFKKTSLNVIKTKDYDSGINLLNIKKNVKINYPLNFNFKNTYKIKNNRFSLSLLLKLRLRKKIKNFKRLLLKEKESPYLKKYKYWVNFLKRRLKKKPYNYFRYYRKRISKYKKLLKYFKFVKLNILPMFLNSKSSNFLNLNLKKKKNKDKNKLYLKLKKRIFFHKFSLKKKLILKSNSKFRNRKIYVRPNLLVNNRSKFYLFVNKLLYYYSKINYNMFTFLKSKSGIKFLNRNRKVLLLFKLKSISIYKNKKLLNIFKILKKNKKKAKKLKIKKFKNTKNTNKSKVEKLNFKNTNKSKVEKLNFKNTNKSKVEKLNFKNTKNKFISKSSNKSSNSKKTKVQIYDKKNLLNKTKFKKKYRIFNIDFPRFVYENYSFTQKRKYKSKLFRNRVSLKLYHTDINDKIINKFYVNRSLCKRKTIIFSKICFLSFFKKYFLNLKYLSFYYFVNKYDSNKTFRNLNYSSIFKVKVKSSLKRFKKVKSLIKILNEIKILNPIFFALSKEQRKLKMNYNYNKVKDYVNLNLIKPSNDNDLNLLKNFRQHSIFTQDLKLVRSKMLLQFIPLNVNGSIWRCFDELKLFNSQYVTLSLKIKFFSWLYNRIFNLNALITSLESQSRLLYNPWRGIYFCFSIEIYLKQLEKVFFKVFDSNYLINFKSDLLLYWKFINIKINQVKNKIFSHLSFYTQDLLNKMNVASLNLFISQNIEKFKNVILKQSFLIFKLSPDLWKYAIIQKLVTLPVSILSYLYPFYQVTSSQFISSGLVFFKELIIMEFYDDSLLELKQLSDEFMSYQIFLRSRHKKLLRQKNKLNNTYIQISSSKPFNFEKRIQLLKFYQLS